jgi:hypothetical protein
MISRRFPPNQAPRRTFSRGASTFLRRPGALARVRANCYLFAPIKRFRDGHGARQARRQTDPADAIIEENVS